MDARGAAKSSYTVGMAKAAECAPVCGWKLERAAWRSGALRMAGLDEVGRGPMFGPVVAATVILKRDGDLEGLTDSKQLTEKQRDDSTR